MARSSAHILPSIALLPPKGHKARRLALWLLTLAPFLFGALALYLGQDGNWDLRNYHWYNAYALVNGRFGFDLLPSQTPYFYNPALDVPFFLLAQIVSAKVAGFVLGTVQGLNFVLLFMLAYASLNVPNPKNKALFCALLAALGMLGGGGIAQIGTSFYDNITSLGIFGAALLVIRFYETMRTAKLCKALWIAILCGLPAGIIMGLKLPSVVFCVGLCAAFLFVTGSFLRRVWLAFGFGLGVLIGLSVSLGPWASYLQTEFHNPLFPYFNNFFHSPYAPDSSARDVQFLPTNWQDRLAFPFIWTKYPTRVGEIIWRDLRLPLLYILLPFAGLMALLFGRRKKKDPTHIAEPMAARYLLWMAIISYVVWLFMFAIYRYAIPLEMLAPLLLVFTMGLLPVRPQPRSFLIAFVLIAIAVTVQPGDWGRHKPWLKKSVEATVPPLGETKDLMILMAGFEPYSHVLTAFPPEVPFVRVQSNFASPEQGKGINKLLEAKVGGHQGRFKLLIPKHHFGFAESALDHFGLTFSPQNCQSVVDHLFDSKLELCDVARKSKPAQPSKPKTNKKAKP